MLMVLRRHDVLMLLNLRYPCVLLLFFASVFVTHRHTLELVCVGNVQNQVVMK